MLIVLTLSALTLGALALAAGAVWTRVLVARAAAAFPPTGTLVDVSGVRLRAHVHDGTGAPVVLVHGAFGGLEDWEASGVVDALRRRGHRVVVFDRPGHGGSDRPAGPCGPPTQAALLAAATRALGIDRPVIVGFSYGGAVALAWAVAHPDEVAALALVNPASHPWRTGHDLVYDLVSWPVIGPVLAHTWLTPIAVLGAAGALANAFHPEPVPPHYRRDAPWRLAVRPRAFRHNAADIRGLEPSLERLAPAWPTLRTPTVILASRDDRVVDPGIHARPLAAVLPAAELRELDGAGHQLPYARTDAVVDAIARAAARARPR